MLFKAGGEEGEELEDDGSLEVALMVIRERKRQRGEDRESAETNCKR
jgi:hypothetical protein